MKTIFALLAALMLTACQPSVQFLNQDITGAAFKSDLTLTTFDGQPLQLNQSNPQLTLMFFGFTTCPDVCPTTLGHMKKVMTQLGDDAAKVRVVFVTLDPERDSAQVMREYMGAFDSSFIGARADLATTTELAKGYQVTFEKIGNPAMYMLKHSANTYIIDTAGKTRVSIPYNTDASSIVHDVRQLLK